MTRCGCGCNSNISYGSNKCCSRQSSSINACKDPFAYLRENFVTPADNVILQIEVTDSSKLYVGQGIQIGEEYFQIASIEDSISISIVQNGTATPGLNLVALHPTYGCYQYPILFVGPIDQLIAPEVAGLDEDFEVLPDTVLTPVKQLTFSYLSPTKVLLEFEMSATIAVDPTAPRYIEVELPVAVSSGAPQATFASMIDNGLGFVPAIAYRNTTTTLVIALDGNTDLADEDSIFRVSGSYDLQ